MSKITNIYVNCDCELLGRASMPGILFLERLQGRLTKRVDVSSDSASGANSRSSASSKGKRAASADDSSQELSPPPKKLSRSKSPVPVTFHPKTPDNTAGSGIDDEASTGNRRVHALPSCGLVYTWFYSVLCRVSWCNKVLCTAD